MNGDIAIIGMGCLFPGARTPEEFWENLIHGRDTTSMATADDLGLDPSVVFDPRKGQIDKTYALRGGYIRDFQFDPTGYQVPAATLVGRDPSVQWPLYAAREALRDGRQSGAALARCGVVVGNLSFPTRSSYGTYAPLYRDVLDAGLRAALAQEEAFEEETFRLPPNILRGEPDRRTTAGRYGSDDLTIAAAPAMVLAEALGLGGPSFVLDAACASSLYAIDLACRYLASGEADLMLAGAVSAADPLMITMGFSIFQAYPETGQSRPLDRTSGGLTSAEGAGMIVLKRYEDAIRDGDPVYARVRSVGLSNDGAGRHPLIPRPEGQEAAYIRAYRDAGIAPESIQYIECHATGTPTGDIVELDGMDAFFRRPVLCGSVKSNFGHLLTAAGIASVLKVVLAMRRGILPPTIGIASPLASQGGIAGGSSIVTAPTPWPVDGVPRRAAINAFGFGGTNAHLILEEPGDSTAPAGHSPRRSRPGMAITGLDLCFGTVPDRDTYSAAIHGDAGNSAIDIPFGRWKGIDRRRSTLAAWGLREPPRGGYLEGFDLDLMRARVQPDDSPIAQHLLLLKVADNAIHDARLSPGRPVAVLVAMDTDLSLHRYRARIDLSWQIRDGLEAAGIEMAPAERAELERIAKDVISDRGQVNRYMSFIGNIMASRISALWDFSGPAFTVSAGEQSVPRALDLAQMLLMEGHIEAVVVGAIDLAGGPESVLRRNIADPYADGMARIAFDVAAEGLTAGEGAGAIVLQRQDGVEPDRTYATVDAVRIAHSISAGGVTADSVSIACRDSLVSAGVAAHEIGYLDVHTGTQPSSREQVVHGVLTGYAEAAGDLTCALGSAYAGVGNAPVATPMAALIRTALVLSERVLPGTAQWSGPIHPEWWKGSPFYVPHESQPWLLDGGARRHAALLQVTPDGSAAHIVLSEPTAELGHSGETGRHAHSAVNSSALHSTLVPVAGDTPEDVLSSLEDLDAALQSGSSLQALDAQRLSTYMTRKSRLVLSLVADSGEEMHREIERARSGVRTAVQRGGEWSTPAGSYFTTEPAGDAGVCFIYPGGFSSYLGQGSQLFGLVPGLHGRLGTRIPHLQEMLAERAIYPRSLDALSPDRLTELEHHLLQQSDLATASASVLAIATTSILRDDFRVAPHFAFGYSLGEATMMWALGVWAEFDTAYERFRTWSGMPVDERANNWKTYLLLASPEAVQEVLHGAHDVHMTIVSTAGEVFIVGDPAACEGVIARLGCGYTLAPFTQVLHCPPVHHAFDRLVDLYRYPVAVRPEIDLYSASQYGPMVLEEDAIARSIASVICQPLDFPRLVQSAYDAGARVFVEMGPGSTCARWVRSILRGHPHVTAAMDARGVSSGTSLLRTVAKLLSHGVSVDLSPLVRAMSIEGGAPHGDESHSPSLRRHISLCSPDPYEVLGQRRGSFHTTRRAHPPTNIAQPLSSFPEAPTAPVPVLPSAPAASRAPVAPLPVPVASLAAHAGQVADSHLRLLRMREEGLRSMAELIRHGIDALDIIATAPADHSVPSRVPAVDTVPLPPAPLESPVVWNEAHLLEFAAGRIAAVFGPEYSVIDRFSRRVRLPMPPYLLVNRVTDVRTTGPGMQPATITTEYDIPRNAWYSTNGRLPVGIAIEAGQCDLLLISYLGVDFQNRGERVYRLLDCTLTFMADLPSEGQTLRYEISIDSFARSGESLLFFFHYRCFLGDVLVLKMDNGCAGFFTDDELNHGRGVIETDRERVRRESAVRQRVTAPRLAHGERFDRNRLEALSRGDLDACFGPGHAGSPSPALRLPSPDLLMLDRVVSVEPDGGPWGLGRVEAEKDLRPDDWYFPCHFKDDQVLAGSLVAEGCVQLLEFYLLYLGLHVDIEDAVFQPIRDLPQNVRCRGQITPEHSRLTYVMEVVSIDRSPGPAAVANVDIMVDGKTVVRFTDLGVRIDGRPAASALPTAARAHALFHEDQVREFATGSIVSCFGPEYAVYATRRTPRIPNGDLQFISRVVEIDGTRGDLSAPSSLLSEYDVAHDVWFYSEANEGAAPAQPDPPYSVLMEMGLQPCGFLSGWLGSTLRDPDIDFYFRNLDGRGKLLRHIDLRGKTVQARVLLRSSTRSVGVIIQSFAFNLSCDGSLFYEGDAVFGYFTPSALRQQTGLDGGKLTGGWLVDHPDAAGREIDLMVDRTVFSGAPGRPLYRLTGGHLDLLDRAVVVPMGGQYGCGYIECSRIVRPQDWFFDCHFFQDPVMPGSLGVEAMMQALHIFALGTGLGNGFASPCFGQVVGEETIWKYRGQIRREAREMSLEMHVRAVEREGHRIVLRGDGSLWRDGLRIYEVRNLAVEVRESGAVLEGSEGWKA